jgi:L-fucose isomerase-like protein
MNKFLVGIAASSLDIFVGNGEEVYKKNLNELKKLEKRLDFELLVYDSLLNTKDDAVKAGTFFENKKIDMLIYFHATNAVGDIIFELAKFGFFIGLWAVEEVYKTGPLANASLIGLNQSSAIIRHFFGNNCTLFKWFYGAAQGELFLPKFKITLKVLKLIKSLKNSRVGLVGNISPGFKDMVFDERDIFKRLGVDVVRNVNISDLLNIAETINDSEITEISEKLIKNAVKISTEKTSIIKSVKLYEALRKISEDNQFKAIALGCWPEIEDNYKIMPCLASSLLNTWGIPISCEGDLLSALSLLILRAFNEEPGVVMDLADFDLNNNSIQLWHCGNMPICLAQGCKYSISNHYAWYNKLDDGTKIRNFGAIIDAKFKESEITVFRIVGDAEKYYYFTGKSLDNKDLKTFDGGRGWIGDLKLFKNPVNTLDLINTIIINGIPHHYPLTFKDASDENKKDRV